MVFEILGMRDTTNPIILNFARMSRKIRLTGTICCVNLLCYQIFRRKVCNLTVSNVPGHTHQAAPVGAAPVFAGKAGNDLAIGLIARIRHTNNKGPNL